MFFVKLGERQENLRGEPLTFSFLILATTFLVFTLYKLLFCFLIFFRVNFTNPLKIWPFFQTPPNIQKLSLTPLELSKNLPPSVQIRAQIFLKRPKYRYFSFFKKIKKHFGS
jgi:hypothetical protein